MAFCTSCGFNNKDDSAFCEMCGTPLQNNANQNQQPAYAQQAGAQPYAQQGYPQQGAQPAYGQPAYTQQPVYQQAPPVYSQNTYNPQQQIKSKPSRKGLAAGILSIIFSGIFLSIIFSPVAIVKGANVLKKYGVTGSAIAAIVLGVIGLLLSVLFGFMYFGASGILASYYPIYNF